LFLYRNGGETYVTSVPLYVNEGIWNRVGVQVKGRPVGKGEEKPIKIHTLGLGYRVAYVFPTRLRWPTEERGS
jgi:hypothetical protein